MCKNLDFLGLGKVSLCMAWLASLVIPQLSLSRQNQVNVSVITAKDHMWASLLSLSGLGCQQKLPFKNMDYTGASAW